MESGAVRYGKRERWRRYIWSLRFLSLSLLDGGTVRCGERERTLRFDTFAVSLRPSLSDNGLRFDTARDSMLRVVYAVLCVRLFRKTVTVRYGER